VSVQCFPYRRLVVSARGQPLIAPSEHRKIEPALAIGIERTVEDAIELGAVIRNQQEIDTCIERLHDRAADIAAIDGAHYPDRRS